MPRDIEALVGELTLDEKAALLAGAGLWSTVAVERLGIPAVQLTDGPNGARGAVLPASIGGTPPTTMCLPCGSALGATWDPSLVGRVGALIAREARRLGYRVLLAPTVNLHRSPLGGRTFEAYSEDPLLTGLLAAAFVRGAQGEGVVCTVKHFVGNESETDRFVASSEVDERTLRELYLRPFEIAVRDGGALGVMTAYNRLNGEHCSDSAWLVGDVLRGEWGFDGFVVSDWFALVETVEAITAGLDLEMPGPGRAYGPALADAVRRGAIDEAVVDAAVRRLLGVLDRVGALDDAPTGSVDGGGVSPVVGRAASPDRDLARAAAVGAMVLLRNDGVLPLAPRSIRSLAVIGPNAGRAVIMGGGSAGVTVEELRSPLAALRDRLGPSVTIVHEPGVDITRTTPAPLAEIVERLVADLGPSGEAPLGPAPEVESPEPAGPDETAPAVGADGIDRAVVAAAAADAVVVIVGTDEHWEGEGGDRTSLTLPGHQDELVRRVLRVAPHAIVVVNAGSPVAMPWGDQARALLQIWFGGQEMAEALVDVLLGVSEPGGRLPTTFPSALEHTPSFTSFPSVGGRIRYEEGVFVGYRWYDARRLPVAFPFGHGLSYTTFAIGRPELSSLTFAPGETLRVTVAVTNTGARRGKEVLQLYVAAPGQSVRRPPAELRAFAAVTLEPGETATVELTLDDRSFAYWHDPEPGLDADVARLTATVPWVPPPPLDAPGWRLEAGRHELRIGRSSVDIAHVVAVEVTPA